jgi:hypothetical protein
MEAVNSSSTRLHEVISHETELLSIQKNSVNLYSPASNVVLFRPLRGSAYNIPSIVIFLKTKNLEVFLELST